MLPVTPTTSGSNRRRQPAATAPSAASASATRTTVTSPRRRRVGRRPGDEQRGRAGRDRVGRGRRGRRSARRAGRRTACRAHLAGIDRGAADGSVRPGEQPAAGQPDEVVGREGGRSPGSGGPGSTDRRRSRPASVAWRRAHRSRSRPASSAGSGSEVRRRDRVGGDAPEQLERHHRHLQLADPGDRRRALLDPDRDDEVGASRLRPMYPTNE